MSYQAPHRSTQPADQRTVRRHNLSLVLNQLARADGRRSRARLSAETGLNPSTVSSLTEELIARGLVREAGIEQSGSIGRPGRSLEINPEGGVALGLEISDDGIAVFAVDITGAPRYRSFVQQDNHGRSPSDVLDQVGDMADEALKPIAGRAVPVVATIALPGLVSTDGSFLEAPNIGWQDVPVLERWRAKKNRPALILDNEARLAAYAEMTLGAGSAFRTFGYVSGGTGLGAGIVINRELYRGAHGFAGEFGHITIAPDGSPSAWGARGTIETLAGERALAALAGLSHRRGNSRRGNLDSVGVEIASLAREQNREALAAIETVGHTIGVGLATLSNLFDLEAIVLGGYLTHLSDWLRVPIETELRERVVAHRWNHSRLFFSSMGREAAVRGAAAWSLRTVFSDFSDGAFSS